MGIKRFLIVMLTDPPASTCACQYARGRSRLETFLSGGRYATQPSEATNHEVPIHQAPGRRFPRIEFCRTSLSCDRSPHQRGLISPFRTRPTQSSPTGQQEPPSSIDVQPQIFDRYCTCRMAFKLTY